MTEEVITETKTWKGTSIKVICRGKGHWSFAVPPLVPARYHSVLFEVPVTLQGSPKAHCTRDRYLWDDDHVRMPFSEKNLFPVSENNSDSVKERWKIIKDVLVKPITNSHEFEAALNKYNSNLPKFEALHYFFNEEMESEESKHFFIKLLPKIIALALQLPELLASGIPLLKQNYNRSLSMSQLQIACLLANAFLCTFPWKKGTASTYPGVNFVTLFTSFSRPKRKQCICEKLKSICNYFKRVTQNVPIGVVTFERKIIPRSAMPRWDKLGNNLGNTKIHISSEGTIEDNGLGFLQVDFANSNIGGGVLRYGCVQEEIRFVICPELIISRLFVERLMNGESVVITGVERYSNYVGYGDTFEWAGDCLDDTPYDVYGRRKTTVCVIDATRFARRKEQFQSSLMIRELNKAYVGFFTREKDNLAPVATGNWGCGAFNGSKQLKTLIQLMACTAANRDLVYYSFGDEELMENFYNIHSFIGNNQITIAQLWRFLNQFALRKLEEDELYSYIQQAYFDSKSQPTITNFFGSTKDELRSPAPSTSFNKKMSKPPKVSPKKDIFQHEEAMVVIEQTSSSSSSSEDIIAGTPPEIVKKITKPEPVDIASKLPKTGVLEIFDALDGNGNRSKNSTPDSGVNSASEVLSTMDKFTKRTQESPVEVVIVDEERMEVETAKPQQSPSKKKITDFFNKINK